MVRVEIDKGDSGHVDRDGRGNSETGREGFNISIGGAEIHFDDEEDAVELARLILHRMGYDPPILSRMGNNSNNRHRSYQW